MGNKREALLKMGLVINGFGPDLQSVPMRTEKGIKNVPVKKVSINDYSTGRQTVYRPTYKALRELRPIEKLSSDVEFEDDGKDRSEVDSFFLSVIDQKPPSYKGLKNHRVSENASLPYDQRVKSPLSLLLKETVLFEETL